MLKLKDPAFCNLKIPHETTKICAVNKHSFVCVCVFKGSNAKMLAILIRIHLVARDRNPHQARWDNKFK